MIVLGERCCDYQLGGEPGRCARCGMPCWDHPREVDGTSHAGDRLPVLAEEDRRAIRAVVFGALLVLVFGIYVMLSSAFGRAGADARDVQYAGSGAAVSRAAAMVARLHAVEDAPVGGGGVGSAPLVASSSRPPGR